MNIVIMICLGIALVVWIFSIWLLFTSIKENPLGSLFATIMAGILGFLFVIPSIVVVVNDPVIKEIIPTSIIKTNNVTMIVYIDEKRIVQEWHYTDVAYWNSTNIVIKVNSGMNFWHKEASEICSPIYK
jgi:hypothetical protein